MTEISVVVPVYGCESCLRELHARLGGELETLAEDFEIVFVDDRSPDGSWEALRAIAAEDDRVRVLRLSKNFGQHAAITAGLATASGRWVAVMDCDLQDPPEQLGRLYAKAMEGFDVVLSRRTRRRGPWARRVSGSAYHRARRALGGGDMFTNHTNLSLVSRKVVDAFLTLRDKDRQYLLILDWLGFRRAEIEVEQAERPDGRSSYNLRSLVTVAVDGIFFQSTVLLRWIVYTGFLFAAAGVLLAAYTLIAYAAGRSLPDWTLLPVMLLMLTGFIIISTGITGLYVGKIFDQVKGRPLYVVDTKIEDGVERSFARPLGDRDAADPGTDAVQL